MQSSRLTSREGVNDNLFPAITLPYHCMLGVAVVVVVVVGVFILVVMTVVVLVGVIVVGVR